MKKRTFLLILALLFLSSRVRTVATTTQQGSVNSPAIPQISISVAAGSVPLQIGTSQNFTATLTGDVLIKVQSGH